jgi:hypothetical protein
MKILVQTETFDLGAEVDAMRTGRTDIGAIASFVGLARDINEGSGVAAMTLEHYPGMTEKALAKLVDEANTRWTLQDVTRDPPGRPPAAGRSHRAGRGGEPASRRSLRRLRVHHGLSEDAGAVLEEGRNCGRRALGRGTRQRRRGGGALGRTLIQSARLRSGNGHVAASLRHSRRTFRNPR